MEITPELVVSYRERLGKLEKTYGVHPHTITFADQATQFLNTLAVYTTPDQRYLIPESEANKAAQALDDLLSRIELCGPTDEERKPVDTSRYRPWQTLNSCSSNK